MSITGVLEDLPLADVVQFIHIGRRTGTLYLWRNDLDRAEIGFAEGRIVSTRRPDRAPLGDQLLEEGLIDRPTLDRALALQREVNATGAEPPNRAVSGDPRPRPQRSIGQILVEQGVVRRADLYRLLKVQITDTIFELVTWDRGRFHFEVDELDPLDDLAFEPREVLDDLDLNTQMLLLEATRIFDERQQARQAKREARLEAKRGARASAAQTLPPLPNVPAAFEALRCQVVTDDESLVPAMRDRLRESAIRVLHVVPREAGNKLPGEGASPLVVIDLRKRRVPSAVDQLTRTRPAAPVVALVDDSTPLQPIVAEGAVATPVGIEALCDVCRNLARVLRQPRSPSGLGVGQRGGFGRFRRVVYEVQSGLLSATMALNLMHVISDSVERAILFLVRGRRMMAVGAFGFAGDGRSLAEITRGLRLEPSDRSALRRACIDAKPVVSEFGDAKLPPRFARLIGPPASGQSVIFPVLGTERVISVIYTDNGAVEQPIEDVRILELATAQVGVALENEMMQQEFADRGVAEWLDSADDT